MRYVKKYDEGFLDYFKKKTYDDQVTLDMINRLSKVKDYNPYMISEVSRGDLPLWKVKNPSGDTEYYYRIYLVRFDDIDLLITGGYHMNDDDIVKNKVKYKMFIGSDVGDLCERINSIERYRERLFTLVDKIHHEDIERSRIDRIRNEINPAADLL